MKHSIDNVTRYLEILQFNDGGITSINARSLYVVAWLDGPTPTLSSFTIILGLAKIALHMTLNHHDKCNHIDMWRKMFVDK